MKRYHVEYKTGNICFDGYSFESFEDAWDFLYYVADRDPGFCLEDYKVVYVGGEL
jgi:hypothetical protein